MSDQEIPTEVAAPAHGDSWVGRTVAGYRIDTVIGRGGMGVVYRAEDVRLSRQVALKVLPSEIAHNVEFRERFLREARLAASLDHPNILPVYYSGEEGDQLYLVVRLVRGHDLGAMIEELGRLEVGQTLYVLRAVASALDAAHDRGLVHRDVKPGNILVEPPVPGHSSGHVFLSDFGLTKAYQTTQGTGKLTKTGYFVGTAAYSAPEQIMAKAVDGRTDQYSLGCVLYECLTGHLPFERDSDSAMLVAHAVEPPPRLVEPPGLEGLNAVLARALAKSPQERYDTCGHMMAAAAAAIGPVAPAGAASLGQVPPPPSFRPGPSHPAVGPPPAPVGSIVAPIAVPPPAPALGRPPVQPRPVQPPFQARPVPPSFQARPVPPYVPTGGPPRRSRRWLAGGLIGAIVVGIIVAIVALSGGGGSPGGGNQGGARLTHAQYQSRLNQLAATGRQLQSLSSGLGSADLQQVANALGRAVNLLNGVVTEFSSLNPPADADSENRVFVIALQDTITLLSKAEQDARAGDQTAVTNDLAGGQAITNEVKSAVDGLKAAGYTLPSVFVSG